MYKIKYLDQNIQHTSNLGLKVRKTLAWLKENIIVKLVYVDISSMTVRSFFS